MQPFPAPRRFGVLALAFLLATACSRPAPEDAGAAVQPGPEASAEAAATAATGAAGATGEAVGPAGPGSPAAELLDQYQREAGDLAAAIAAGAETDRLRSQAEGLIERAAEIVPAFVEVHPHCTPYLEAALAVRERWPQLDHDAIERDYHHDGALPKIDNAGFCYHMKDLITHPATVLVLLSQAEPDHAHAKAEIDEVIAHMGVVRGQL
jgi:hypothetical protein